MLFCFLKALLLQRDSSIPTVMFYQLVQCSELESGVVCSVLHIEKHAIVLLLTQSMQQEIQSVHVICILFSIMFNKFDSEILVSMK